MNRKIGICYSVVFLAYVLLLLVFENSTPGLPNPKMSNIEKSIVAIKTGGVKETLDTGYLAALHSWMNSAEEDKESRDVSAEINVAKSYAEKLGVTLAEKGYRD